MKCQALEAAKGLIREEGLVSLDGILDVRFGIVRAINRSIWEGEAPVESRNHSGVWLGRNLALLDNCLRTYETDILCPVGFTPVFFESYLPQVLICAGSVDGTSDSAREFCHKLVPIHSQIS